MIARQTDYIIVGQGIAGTVLSFTFLQKGKKILVVDANHPVTSSKVAAGIFNPVTGKRLAKTWQADLLFPFLHQFYRQLETVVGTTLLYSKNVYRPFLSIEEQNAWTAKTASPELSPYTNTQFDQAVYASGIRNPFGGLEIMQAGYIDVPAMLKSAKLYLQQHNLFSEEPFHYQDIHIEKDTVHWKGIQAKKIIFCEGAFVDKNPYFNWLPFNNVKGEILTVRMSGLQTNNIINRGVFIVPLEKDRYKVGATYTWDDPDWQVTRQARYELEEKLTGLITVPFAIEKQQAGIRPASLDRRPFLGLHPYFQELGIFNGLGTKGVSLAPFYARHFYEFLEENKELDKEAHINRYFSLYYKSDKLNNYHF